MEGSAVKTERDYIDIIGKTAFTTSGYREKRWNQYYFRANVGAVECLLKGELPRETILDVGCSHGSWYGVWKKMGFKKVIGIDMSAERAEEARLTGFDVVHNCMAQSMPIEAGSVKIGCSNDMFVHVLQLKDKLNIIQEVYRVLAPGGVFIFNFNPPRAYGYVKDRIEKHCSFYSLNTMLEQVIDQSKFVIEDIKTSYFPRYSLVRKILGYGIILPFAVSALRLHDKLFSQDLPINMSSSIYLKLRKK